MAANALMLLGCGKAGKSDPVRTLVWQENGTPTTGTNYWASYLPGLADPYGANTLNTNGWNKSREYNAEFKYNATTGKWYAAGAGGTRTAIYSLDHGSAMLGASHLANWRCKGVSGSGSFSHHGAAVFSNATGYCHWYMYDKNNSSECELYFVVDGVAQITDTNYFTTVQNYEIEVRAVSGYATLWIDGVQMDTVGDGSGTKSWAIAWSPQIVKLIGYTETTAGYVGGATDIGWSNERVYQWL